MRSDDRHLRIDQNVQIEVDLALQSARTDLMGFLNPLYALNHFTNLCSRNTCFVGEGSERTLEDIEGGEQNSHHDDERHDVVCHLDPAGDQDEPNDNADRNEAI